MGLFGFRGSDQRELLAEAYDLALAYKDGAPADWRALTAAEIGAPPEKVDELGFFTGDGWLDAQAMVLGKYVGGQLVKLSISYVATNNSTEDNSDYAGLGNDTYALGFTYLLEAVRTYAAGAGLSGRDVIVTGYSLGGAAANTMAAHRDTLWGGFYADSDYITLASPKLTEVANVYNFGFENDVVHRLGGEGDKDPRVGEPLFWTKHNDGPYGTATDNIVLFNQYYANPAFPVAPFILFNYVEAWSAHTDAGEFNAIRFLAGSHFADFMEVDSTIVISWLKDLPEEVRPTIWVEDKPTSTSDHYGTMGFILGSATADSLGDGRADDFLDGFAGDDRFRLSTGNDHVHGGGGTDTVLIAGGLDRYDAVRLSDGTLFLHDRTGEYGLETLESVERLTEQTLLGRTFEVTRTGLHSGFTTKAYVAHREGTDGANALTAAEAGERLFGLDGNDRLLGRSGDDLLVGGRGADLLNGAGGADQLFGGAGDDVLVGGAGDDRLSGGVGSDLFDFRKGGLVGDDVITDFDMGLQGDDRIAFDREDFASFADLLDHVRTVGADLIIDGPDGSVRLVGVSLSHLTEGDFLFA